jgi:hypothetical protein
VKPDTPTKSKIAALTSEMEGIRFVNSLYWGRREAATPNARADYQRTLDRLEEIRIELSKTHDLNGREGKSNIHPLA